MEGRNRVKRAIILAAGYGKRMHPITNAIPKPLIRVNGIKMIDTIVNGLHKNGIFEIYVVVGYLKDQFYEWAKEKKCIKIIENPYFNTCNNISSLYVARYHLDECIILDGDQFIYNYAILDPYFDLSGYNAVWCEGGTNEWLLEVDGGIIKQCSRTGGHRGWQLYSISRWSNEDGKKLRYHIEKEFDSGNRQLYWDDVPLFCYPDDYVLGVYEMQRKDVIEIDSLDELIAVDQSYQSYLTT